MSASEALSRKVLAALASHPPLSGFLHVVAAAVERAGGSAYLVGGTLRDILGGESAKDIDIMVAGLPENGVTAALSGIPAKTYGILRIARVGKAFPVRKIRTTWAAGEIDVARARGKTRGADAAARRDASLRDFTINSLQFRLASDGGGLRGTLLDPEGGLHDIARRRIRAVGDPAERFREDPVRMLRAIRMRAERDGYTIERATWAAIRELAPALLPDVPADRIAVELARALSASPARAAADLARSGILSVLVPGSPPWGAFRTRRLVRRMEILARRSARAEGPLPFLAALFADQAEEEGSKAARRRPGPARRAAGGVLDRKAFRLPGIAAAVACLRLPQSRTVVRLLEGHLALLHAGLLRNARAQLESVLRRWDDPETLLAFHASLRTAAGARVPRFREFLRRAAARPRLLSGGDLRDLGFRPGPEIARALETIRERTLAGSVRTRAQALAAARSLLRASPPKADRA